MTSVKYPRVIDTAFINPKVKELFENISSQTRITFIPVEGDGWTASTSDGQTEIEFGHAQAPAEALAHELLHTELKLKGYLQYLSVTGLVPRERLLLYIDVLAMLDNELQHHRMYARFSDLGLASNRFYADSDSGTYARVKHNAARMDPNSHVADFLLIFASVIAPGGEGCSAERQSARDTIELRCGPSTWKTLTDVEELIANWTVDASIDAAPYLQRLLSLLAGADRIWFGPADCADLRLGYFIGRPFTKEDVTAYWHSERN